MWENNGCTMLFTVRGVADHDLPFVPRLRCPLALVDARVRFSTLRRSAGRVQLLQQGPRTIAQNPTQSKPAVFYQAATVKFKSRHVSRRNQ